MPLISLVARLCALCLFTSRRFKLILSSDGAFPRYQAVGDDGDMGVANCDASRGNIGLGLCIGEPSEPRRRRTCGIP